MQADEYIGYVALCTKRSLEETGLDEMNFVVADKVEYGDICHTGNGPTSRPNAAFFAEAANARDIDRLDIADDSVITAGQRHYAAVKKLNVALAALPRK
jgi:hypothetical protein